MARLVLDRGVDALPRGEGVVERIVIPADPTLDDMLAAMIVHRLLTGQDLPEGLKAFTVYAAIVREGYKPGEVSLENSLEGIYLAVRNNSNDFTRPVDLTDPAAARRFVAAWMPMAAGSNRLA